MINYTLKQLYSFESVIRLGGFTSASKELHITQPAVYMQVQQLQENIGTKLFDINGKKISPTFVGKKIYKTALDTINSLESSKLEIDEIEVGEKVYLAGNTAGIAPEAWDTIRKNKIFLKF